MSGERGGHASTAGPDDEHVDDVIEFDPAGRSFGHRRSDGEACYQLGGRFGETGAVLG